MCHADVLGVSCSCTRPDPPPSSICTPRSGGVSSAVKVADALQPSQGPAPPLLAPRQAGELERGQGQPAACG